MFVDAGLTIGPPSLTLLNMNAMGLIIVNGDGLAVNLELQSQINLGLLFTETVSFFLITNTTSKNETYTVPETFIFGSYLTQNFINTYIQEVLGASIPNSPTASPADLAGLNSATLPADISAFITGSGYLLGSVVTVKINTAGSWWEISDGTNAYAIRLVGSKLNITQLLSHQMVIHGGMPMPDGTYAAPGVYVVVVGQGNITIANSLFLSGSFQIQISSSVFSLQMNAAYSLKLSGVTLFSGSASGGLNISSAGLYGYLDLTYGVGLPASTGFGFSGCFQFQINTTSSSQTINQFKLDSNGNLVVDGSGNMVLQQAPPLDPNTTQVLFGGNLALGPFSVKGYTLIKITLGSFEVAIGGKAQLGSLGSVVLLGSAGLYIENGTPVFACRISTYINLAIPTVSIFGQGTFFINTSAGTTYENVAPASFSINLVNGTVQFASILNVNANVTISYVGGVFRIALNNATLDVFGFVNITVKFFVQSDGQFEVYGSTSGNANFVVVNMAYSLIVDVWNCQPGACLINHGGATFGININIYGSMGIDLGIASVSASFNSQIALANTYALLSMGMTFRIKLFWFLTVNVNWNWSHTWTPVIQKPNYEAPYDPNYSFYSDAFSLFWYVPSDNTEPEPTNGILPSIDIVWATGNDGTALLPGGFNLVVFHTPGSLVNEFILINTNLVDRIQLLPVTLDNLPAALPAGIGYLDAFQINLFSQGKMVTQLETWASLMMAFSIPAGIEPGKMVILYWNPALNGGKGGWVRLQITLLKYLGNGKWAIDTDQLQLLKMALEKMAAQSRTGLTGELGTLAAVNVNNGGVFVLALEP